MNQVKAFLMIIHRDFLFQKMTIGVNDTSDKNRIIEFIIFVLGL